MVGHMKCNATALAIVSAAVAVTTTWQGQVRVESVSGLKLNLRGPGMPHMAWVTTPQISNFRSSRSSKSKGNANDQHEKIQTTSTRHNTRVSQTISKATSKLQRAGAAVVADWTTTAVEMAQSGAGVARQGLGMASAMRRRSKYMTSAERQEVVKRKRLELETAVVDARNFDAEEEKHLRELNLSDDVLHILMVIKNHDLSYGCVPPEYRLGYVIHNQKLCGKFWGGRHDRHGQNIKSLDYRTYSNYFLTYAGKPKYDHKFKYMLNEQRFIAAKNNFEIQRKENLLKCASEEEKSII